METILNQEKLDKEYRPINMEFLENTGYATFDIYYKTSSLNTVKLAKFVSSNPRDRDKMFKLMESGLCDGKFFVHEDDLFRYYGEATKTLRTFVSDPAVPIQVKTKKVYDVSKGIMKEFFEYNASNKVLEASSEVMAIMDECLSNNVVGFYAISQITNKDYYTYTHSVNVGLYCMTYGIKNKMSSDMTKQMGLGGMFHDVGKSKVPATIINKDGQLTDDEFLEMKQHAPLGMEMLLGMKCYGKCVTEMAGQHHEKYQGGGYPKGLIGDEISFYARVCKLMDVYDALTTRRSYKKGMAPLDALTLMKRHMAPEFDPKLLDKFITLMGPDM